MPIVNGGGGGRRRATATTRWRPNGRRMIDDGSQFVQAAKGGAERVLNQDEIDSLLGFSLADVSLNDNSGIRAIINSAMVSYERLPMLEIVFDRLVRLMTTSLRNFTSDNVEVSLDRITSVRFGDYLNSIPLPAILAVFKAEEWDNFGLFTVNSEPDLFDHRRAARRAARPDRDPHRGPALHDDRDHAGQAHDRGGAGRRRARLRAAVAGQVQHRPAGDQSALRRDLAARQRGDPGAPAHRHGGSRRQHRAAAALRDDRADPRRAAADVHGREIRPRPDLGRPSGDRDRPGRDRRRGGAVRGQAAAAPDDEARGRRHADARDQARRHRHRALRRRDADAKGAWAASATASRCASPSRCASRGPPSPCSRRPNETSKPRGGRSEQRIRPDDREPGGAAAAAHHRLLHACSTAGSSGSRPTRWR